MARIYPKSGVPNGLPTIRATIAVRSPSQRPAHQKRVSSQRMKLEIQPRNHHQVKVLPLLRRRCALGETDDFDCPSLIAC